MNTADFYALVAFGVITVLVIFGIGVLIGYAIGKRSVDAEYYSELRILRHQLGQQRLAVYEHKSIR